MRAYIATTGVIFGLIVIVHGLRAVEEGAHVLRDPFFMVMTALAAGMCLWAVNLWRGVSR